jgi:hypothetical protein
MKQIIGVMMKIPTVEDYFDYHTKRILDELSNELEQAKADNGVPEYITLDEFAWDNLEILGRIAYDALGSWYGNLDDAYEGVKQS